MSSAPRVAEVTCGDLGHEPGWGVEVSEPRLNSTRLGVDWWLTYRLAMPAGRFTERQHTLVGAMVTVACENREHANAVECLFMDVGGMPRAAVKIVRTNNRSAS